MKNISFFLLIFMILTNSIWAQTKTSITETTPSIPTQEYIDLFISKIVFPEEIIGQINTSEIEIILTLTIAKDGSVVNPQVYNDTLGIRPYIKEAITSLPKWLPKTEDGNAIVSKTSFKLAIPIDVRAPEKMDKKNSKANPVNGLMEFHKNFVKNIRPDIGEKDTMKFLLKFIVEKDGSLTNIKVVKSTHPNLNKKIIYIMSSMPNWIPAIQDGEPVRSNFTLPVTLKFTN